MSAFEKSIEQNTSFLPTETNIQQEKDAPKLPPKPLRFTLYFLKPFSLGLFFMVIFEAGQAVATILMPYAVKEIINTVESLNTANMATGSIMAAVEDPLWLFVWLNVGMLLTSRASGTLLVLIGPRMRARTRDHLFAYMQHHSQKYFMGHFSGSLANRVNEVAMSVNHAVWTVMFDFWPVMLTFGVSLYLLFEVHLGLAHFLAGWIGVYVVVSFILASFCRRFARAHAAARSLVSGKVVDAVTNVMNIKLFARKKWERTYLQDYLNYEVKRARASMWFMEAMRWFQNIAGIVLLILLLYMALDVWLAGEITVGEFAMVTSLSLLIINDARGLSRRFLEFFEYVGNINDGVSIIVRSHGVLDKPDAKEVTVSKGEIAFKDVHFTHDAGAKVFEGLDVTIKGGQKVGLVGPSGAGKSTFINLILRMHDLNSGAIKIDGQDIAEVTQDSLRANIAVIPQDPMLFHRSLMENIRYGREGATDEEVFTASKRAFCDDFIQDVPEGYDALVGERGVKLSGGQRQRIAIARAMVKDAPILLLDEATSSLDSESEKYIQQSLNELMEDRTVLVIAHRLSTIASMDRILVFDGGRVVEDGTHEELIKRDGLYARLWRMQAGGFLPE